MARYIHIDEHGFPIIVPDELFEKWLKNDEVINHISDSYILDTVENITYGEDFNPKTGKSTLHLSTVKQGKIEDFDDN